MNFFFTGLSFLILGFALHRFLFHKKLDINNLSFSFKYFTKGETIIFILGIVAIIFGVSTMIISFIFKNRW